MTRRTDARQRTTLGNRFRFLIRCLGLTGLLAAPLGYAFASDVVPTTWDKTPETLEKNGQTLLAIAEGASGLIPQIGVIALAAGLVLLLLWGLVEVFGGLFLVTGKKTAVRTNAVVQMVLATALLVVVNAISWRNAQRFDLTRDHQFTLAPELVGDLGKLRGDSPTTIVVLQLHKTAGTLSDKPDAYDYAAERKVVEKVKDLIDQLREFGPRFNVAVLDVEDEGYERAVKDLTRTRPGLGEAIAAAPENSIFFYADGKVRTVARADADKLGSGPAKPATLPDPADSEKALVYNGAVTRLGFADFYQLDKTASKEATPAEREGVATLIGGPAFAPGVRGKGNLVLIPRGKDAFVRKVLGLEERKPRIGLAVIHPLLTSREQYDEYTASGMRKALEANGFDVIDVILKRWGRGGPPTPAVYTYEESELDRVESRYNLLNLLAYDREMAVKQLSDMRARVEKLELRDLDRMFARQLGKRITTDADRELLRRILDDNVQLRKDELVEFTKMQGEIGAQYRDLLRNDKASENRRVTDLKAKLKQYVDDCDVLIVPRLTVVDLSRGDVIPPSLFNLAKEQAEVVKEFLKAGKPVLFAVGPTNVDRRGGPGADANGDDIEKLLPQLGIELGKQTIITDPEGQAMAERQNEALGTSVELPALVFDLPEKDGKTPNPVTAAFRTTARAVDRKLEVKKSGYRPVYVSAGMAERLPFAAEIAHTVRESWNEDKPLGEDDAVPKFEPAKPDDPKRGTHDEERRGPFPVGVAIETKVPADWFDPTPTTAAAIGPRITDAAFLFPYDNGLYAGLLTVAAEQVKRPTVRVVALGHGGLFTGKRLDPAHETLLLHAVNWQLRRDDRLPRDVDDADKWRFPRAHIAPREATFWTLGTLLGLPALIVYFGLIALMLRKVR